MSYIMLARPKAASTHAREGISLNDRPRNLSGRDESIFLSANIALECVNLSLDSLGELSEKEIIKNLKTCRIFLEDIIKALKQKNCPGDDIRGVERMACKDSN
jgi:hypothetical protein